MLYKLGKLPARVDKRTIKLSSILKALPPIPSSFSVFDNPISPNPKMWGNDNYGDCVEAAMTNHQIHFEITAEDTIIPISTANVLKLYHAIAGPGDPGTNYLDAMNYWRQNGIKVGCCGKWKTYLIDAFASVNWKDLNEVKAAIYLLDGMQVGVQLPKSAEDQYEAGQPWTIVPNSPILGGHGLYFGAYDDDKQMLTCCTWGKKQLVAYDWFNEYPDESYAAVDAKNAKQSVLNIPLLEQYLNDITGGNVSDNSRLFQNTG